MFSFLLVSVPAGFAVFGLVVQELADQVFQHHGRLRLAVTVSPAVPGFLVGAWLQCR